jgi:hypothetical protein
MAETTKEHASGRIEVASYEPRPYDEPSAGPELVEIHVRENFLGDIDGEGVARFLQAQRENGSASFVGIERVSGRIADRQGTFLLQDAGTVEGSRVTGRWSVIRGSGTDGLQGLRGDGGFTAELGQNATITLDYWFE